MSGLDRIAETFAAVSSQGRAALMPYFTLGYPDPQACMAIVEAISRSGADLIELGIPFSDPLADGPTIQRSTQVALSHGVNLAACLEMVAHLRRRGVTQPLLLMGYFNPILAYGVERFVVDAVAAGADGFIVPDLPPEEAAELELACRQNQRALVFLLAPTSTPERIAQVAARSTGFVYLVSLTGVTGARAALSNGLEEFIARTRAATRLPLAVGFGISTPEQAGAVGRLVSGVIIGSALIDAVDRAGQPAQAAGDFIRAFSTRLQAAAEQG